MPSSPNLALSYIVTAQAQKELTHNEALNDLDALAQLNVISRTLNTPPATPNLGDSYIVGNAPTDAWAGKAKMVALWYQGWTFKTARNGWRAFVRPENRLLVFNGTDWVALAAPPVDTTFSWSPGTIANGAGLTSAAVTVNGAALGDYVQIAAPYNLQGLIATAWVSAANTVTARLHNMTGAGVSLATGTWNIRVNKA